MLTFRDEFGQGVCGSYSSRDGSHVPLEMNEQTIAIGFEEMREIPNRIGVSGGISEASANIRAVRAGLLNVLIIDEDTAAGMLAILNAEGSAAGWKPRGRAPRPWSLVESGVAPCEYGRCFPEREVILCSRSC